MRQLIGGLVLLAGGAIGLAETESHQPAYLCGATVQACESGNAILVPDPNSLGEPAYQLLEAASGLLIALGLALLVWAFVKLMRRKAARRP
jgi:hypothetical protein